MVDCKNVLFYVWLSQNFPYGSIKPKQIALKFQNNLSEFYENIEKYALKFDLTQKRINKLKSNKPSDYSNIIKKCQKLKIKIVCFTDALYPKKLKLIDSAPVVLYYVGNLEVASKPSVAIVGTRRASSYGLKTAKNLAKDFSTKNLIVVSGCAEGIDSSAHLGVVEINKPTIAVLGTPIDRPYPFGSGMLKRNIIKNGGLIVSEYAPATEVFPWLFPIRNRIIVGLSDSIVVVESPKKSGAIITANLACDFGKEVFCVPPSNIYSDRNEGIKKILKDGANLLLDYSDVLKCYSYADVNFDKTNNHGYDEIVDYKFSPNSNNLKSLNFKLKSSNSLKKISKKLQVPAHLETLFNLIDDEFDLDYAAQKLNLKISQILEMLTELEILGFIEKLGISYKKLIS